MNLFLSYSSYAVPIVQSLWLKKNLGLLLHCMCCSKSDIMLRFMSTLPSSVLMCTLHHSQHQFLIPEKASFSPGFWSKCWSIRKKESMDLTLKRITRGQDVCKSFSFIFQTNDTMAQYGMLLHGTIAKRLMVHRVAHFIPVLIKNIQNTRGISSHIR